jgi:membrane fusion protein
MAPRAGLIVSVNVQEDQLVEAGAALLTVKVGQSDDSGSDVDRSVLQSLARQRAALLDQVTLEQAKSDADRQQITHRVDGVGNELVAIQAELAAQRERTRVADDQVVAVRDLVKQGYISVVEFKRRQDNLLAQRQNEAALKRQIAERDAEAAQQRDALRQLPDALAARISVLRGSIADLEGRLAEIAGRHAYQLRAPAAGHVSALQARVGLAADTAVPLMSIVPTGSVLQAELLVPSRAIGFVEPGQTVRLAYEAFPFQRFGLHSGHVTTVSRNLLRPMELVAPIAIDGPSYRVIVALDRQTLSAFGRDFPLGPDMTLKADIVFDRRSLLEWVFEPMFSLRGRWS